MNCIANKYQLTKCLGKGQFGAVCQAHCTKTHKYYAVKLERQNAQYSLLKHEATVLHHLNSQKCHHIPYIYYYGNAAPYVTLVMTYYECSLETMKENMTLGEKIEWWNHICSALEKIHGTGIVHRDIKPPHFMKCHAKQEWHLIDFGLATSFMIDHTHIPDMAKDSIVGSPNYVSYYVHEGKECVCRDDFISLIYVFWELLFDSLLDMDCADTLTETTYDASNIRHQYNVWLSNQKEWSRLYQCLANRNFQDTNMQKMVDIMHSLLMHLECLDFKSKPHYNAFYIHIENEILRD